MAHKSRYQLAEEVKQLAARDGISMTEAKRLVEMNHLIEDINELSSAFSTIGDVRAILLRIMRLI